MENKIRIQVDGVDIVDLATMIQALVRGNPEIPIFSIKEVIHGVLSFSVQTIRMENRKFKRDTLKSDDYAAAIGLIYKYCPEMIEHIGKDWSKAKSRRKERTEDYTRDSDGKLDFSSYD